MKVIYCPNCEKKTGHKRALGWSIFFVAILMLSVQAKAGLIPNSWLNSLVLIEGQKGMAYDPIGTGFLVGSKGYKILVTNEHVLQANGDKLPLFIRVNRKDPKRGEALFDRIKIFPMEDPRLKPVFHKKADLAVLYVVVPKTLDLKSINVGEILDSNFLLAKDVPVGDEVLLIGFPTTLQHIREIEKEINIPIIRGGLVSAKFKKNDINLILIDAPSYWGSSGGPVILRPNFYNVSKDPSGDIPPMSQNVPKLVGIVSEMVPALKEWEVERIPGKSPSEKENVQKEKGISVWHSGLSVVIPVDYLTELIEALPRIQ